MSVTPTCTPSPMVNDPDHIAICAGRMYWLALVLTNSEDLAGELTRHGAELLFTVPDNDFFNRWWEKWVCRTTIEACIHAMNSQLQDDQREDAAWDAATDALLFESLELANKLSRSSIESAVRSLPILPRFIFVIHTLNGYTAQETSEMLLIPEAICEAAGRFALVSLTTTVQSSGLSCWVATHRFA